MRHAVGFIHIRGCLSLYAWLYLCGLFIIQAFFLKHFACYKLFFTNMPVLFGASSVGLTSDPSACSIMSRRAAPPDSPWQNGMPPFGLCQQQFNPMMNCGPMWAQPGLPFVGSMAPDMMRFGGNVSARSNFRRNYDQVSADFTAGTGLPLSLCLDFGMPLFVPAV